MKEIVFVLSTNYAGSHFLSLMLSSNKQCCYLGEVHIFHHKNSNKRVCYTCESDAACSLFKGLSYENCDSAYDILFNNIDDPKVTTLIDNSKKTAWAKRFVHLDKYKRKYIHLIRDPRALARRWIMNYDNPKKKFAVRKATARRRWHKCLNIWLGNEVNTYIHKWLYQNYLISDFLKKNKLDSKVVTYRDLATGTSSQVENVMDWLGIEFCEDQLKYWNFKHCGTLKPEYKHVDDNTPKIFDVRWKSFLSEQAQKQIFEHKEINHYLKQQNIDFIPEGLTRSL